MIDLSLLRTASLDAKLLRDIGVSEHGRVPMTDPRIRRLRRQGAGEMLIRASVRLVSAVVATMLHEWAILG